MNMWFQITRLFCEPCIVFQINDFDEEFYIWDLDNFIGRKIYKYIKQ